MDVTHSQTILQKVAWADKNAVRECVDTYGSLVWALAKKHTDSLEKAETAALDIFADIWRNAENFDADTIREITFIRLIAYQRLINLKKKY